MLTPADIKNRFPEFAALSDPMIQMYLDDAYLEVDEPRANIYYDLLIYYLVAHYLALSVQNTQGMNRGSGLVTSMHVGDTTIGFSSKQTTSNADFYYEQTAYGLKFLRYQTFCGGGGMSV
jgi:hypothetical protein